MSETVIEPTGDAEGTVQGADDSAEDQEAQDLLDRMQDEDDPAKLREQISHWRKMSRTHERASRSNSAAAEELRQIKESQKSDLQKAEDARLAAERERDAALSAQNRMLAAAAHDLPTELIDYLGDGTAEDISERAEQLSSIIKAEVDKRVEAASGSQNGGRRQPTPRTVSAMRPGAAPASQAPGNAEQMFRQLITPSD